MGMTKADLYDLSFREFSNKSEGFFKGYKDRCELERLWITLLLSPHSKKSLKPEKLIKFAWEYKQVEVNEEDAKASLERIKKKDKYNG